MARQGTLSKRSKSRAVPGSALIIDGTAEVIARRIVAKTAAERAAASREMQEAATPVTFDTAPAQGFGRRRQSFFNHKDGFGRASHARVTLMSKRHLKDRDDAPDLLRQSLDLSQSLRFFSSAGSLDGEAPLIPMERGLGRRARNAAFLTAGFLVGVLSIPVFLLAAPNAPVAAPYRDAASATGLSVSGGFSLDGVETALVAHGAGKVLTVEGTIRNTADTTGLVPPLRIAMRDGTGIVGERPLRVGVDSLRAGQTVHFVSRLAVASNATGEVSIGFLPASKSRVAAR